MATTEVECNLTGYHTFTASLGVTYSWALTNTIDVSGIKYVFASYNIALA